MKKSIINAIKSFDVLVAGATLVVWLSMALLWACPIIGEKETPSDPLVTGVVLPESMEGLEVIWSPLLFAVSPGAFFLQPVSDTCDDYYKISSLGWFFVVLTFFTGIAGCIALLMWATKPIMEDLPTKRMISKTVTDIVLFAYITMGCVGMYMSLI